jgi:ABC-2 type transport system ATP-binding protein
MKFVVELESVTKRFGKVVALNNVSLGLKGKVSGLIGPNGAGKTTLINILLGYTRPNSGTVRVLGYDVSSELEEVKARVGVLPEKPGFPAFFSGKELLVRVARLRGFDDAEGLADGVLGEVGLAFAGDRAIRTYSAGMYQRLGLAQALIGEPELVILDEPAANLDPLGRLVVLELVANYSREKGVKFLVSTHILYDVERTCDWIAIMDTGQVREQGSVEELVKKYSGLTFRIVVSDVKKFASALTRKGLATSVSFQGDAIQVTAGEGVNMTEETVELAKQLKVVVSEVRPVLGSLDEVFRRVVRGESEKQIC